MLFTFEKSCQHDTLATYFMSIVRSAEWANWFRLSVSEMVCVLRSSTDRELACKARSLDHCEFEYHRNRGHIYMVAKNALTTETNSINCGYIKRFEVYCNKFLLKNPSITVELYKN